MVFSECGFLVAICQLLFICFFNGADPAGAGIMSGVSGGRFAADYIFSLPW